MSLIDSMSVPCVFMVPTKTPDGSGGYITEWVEGESLSAAIVRDTSTEARIAEAAGTVSVYTVTVPRDVHLPFHSVIKRLTDGYNFLESNLYRHQFCLKSMCLHIRELKPIL